MAPLVAETTGMQPVRVDPRVPAAALPGITTVKLSPGDTVKLINLSATGVLVEGATRFVPRTRVTVIFEGGFSPAQIKGRIVRCQVASISNGALQYQSGIAFDGRIALPSVDVAAAQAQMPDVLSATPATAPAVATTVAQGAGVAELRNRW